jgi:acyl carrier protein
MGRVIALEHQNLWGGLIDLDPGSPVDQAGMLALEIVAPCHEDQVAFRNARRHVARLTPLALPPWPGSPRGPWSPGTVLITGGLGGIGFSVARWMVAQGARHLVLIGRTPPSGSTAEEIAGWRRSGVDVAFARADVSQMAQLDAALGPLLAAMPPIKGIVHAAGSIDDGVLLNQDWPRFAAVMAPKVQGAWNLHALSQGQPLEFFVLFSSMAALLGSPGQANYAAGNAFLDALAHFRQSAGLPAVSINWGPWSQVGMAAAQHQRNSERRTALGIGSIAPDVGLAICDRLLLSETAQVGVLPVDWGTLLAQYPPGGEPTLVREIAQTVRQPSKVPGDGGPDLRLILEAGLPQEREAILGSHIRRLVVRILGLDPAQPPELHQNLSEVGMDSLMAVELNQHLQADLGRGLPSTLAFEYPTIHLLTRFIAAEVLPADMEMDPHEREPDTTPAGSPGDTDVAPLSEEQIEQELLRALERKGY